MASLADAQQRLEKALARLEAAAAKPRPKASDEAVRELEALRRKHAILADSSHQVSERLDRAIGRLRTLLEG